MNSLPTALSIGAAGLYPYSDTLMELGSKVSRFGDPYHMFRVSGAGEDRRIQVPRMLVPSFVKDLRADGLPASFNSYFTPRNVEQSRVIDESVSLLLEGENFVVECPTGFGKTACAMQIIATVGLKTLVVVTKEDIRDQWFDAAVKFLHLNPSKIGFIQGDRFEIQGRSLVIAMVQSLAKESRYPLGPLREFGLAIWDECFPAGTMVGSKPIESYSVGDPILSFDGASIPSQVSWVGKKLGSFFARASCGGYTLLSTATQPVFVSGLGFVPAGLLQEGDYVLRQVQISGASTLKENQGAVQEGSSGVLLQGTRGTLSSGEINQEVGGVPDQLQQGTRFCKNDEEQSYARPYGSGESVQGFNWTPVPGFSGWQWSGPDCSPEATLRRFEQFITQSGVPDWSPKVLNGFWASEVHGGYSPSVADACNRTRWAFSQYSEGKGFRPEEGTGIELVRVEGVEVQERGRAIESGWVIGDGTVFNLEVEKYHTYFASGFLVHNCHRVGADYFSQSCYRVPAKLRMGLSATPDRKDGREGVIRSHIGPVRVSSEAAPMTPRVVTRKSPWKVPMTSITDPETGKKSVGPVPHTPGRCGHIINMMAKHYGRNSLLAKFIFTAFQKGRHVLVQSDRIEHLETLSSMVISMGVHASVVGFYARGLSKGDREVIKTKQIIFATYQMTAEATDIPRMDTLVMATPKSDVRQIVGRILRPHKDKAEPLVLDVIDDSSGVFSSYWLSRRKWYKSVGASVSDPVEEANCG